MIIQPPMPLADRARRSGAALLTRVLSALAALLLIALPAAAEKEVPEEQIVAGLSQNRVAITTSFVGSEILIFGAVKRETATPPGALGVIIVVEGPSRPIVVRRKERRFGIWVNAESIEIHKAPSFYAVSSSAPLEQLIAPSVDSELHISPNEMVRLIGAGKRTDPIPYAEAVVRIREADGHYLEDPGGVYLAQKTLFNTHIQLPANLTEGQYKARILLTRNRQVVDEHITYIDVRKVGIERWLYNLAYDQPLLYGLLSLALAMLAGWAASTFFRYVFRQ